MDEWRKARSNSESSSDCWTARAAGRREAGCSVGTWILAVGGLKFHLTGLAPADIPAVIRLFLQLSVTFQFAYSDGFNPKRTLKLHPNLCLSARLLSSFTLSALFFSSEEQLYRSRFHLSLCRTHFEFYGKRLLSRFLQILTWQQ